MLREDITCLPQSVSAVQGLPGQPQAQVQVMKVEYLGSSVGTDTVVRISPADGWAQVVAVALVPIVPVDERLGDFAAVVEATEGVWDGEADDRDSDEEFSASDELLTGQDKLDMWTSCGQAHSPFFRRSSVFRQGDGQCDREDDEYGDDDRYDACRPAPRSLEVVYDGVVVVGIRVAHLLIAGSSSCGVVESLIMICCSVL
jgi:hypothetical protein